MKRESYWDYMGQKIRESRKKSVDALDQSVTQKDLLLYELRIQDLERRVVELKEKINE